MQEQIIQKGIKFHVVDGYRVAEKAGLGIRINTVLQPCFFALSNVLPRDEAITAIKKSIYSTYGKRGDVVLERNYEAVDLALAAMHEVKVPARATGTLRRTPLVTGKARDLGAWRLGGAGESGAYREWVTKQYGGNRPASGVANA